MRLLTNAIKTDFLILSNPDKQFRDMHARKFETILSDYLILLLASGILAGIATLLYSLGKSLYLAIFYQMDIQYMRMVNYLVGSSTSLMFFYFFAGTFIVFIASILLKPFFRRIKYTKLLELMFYSFSPLLLFGWIPVFFPALLIWAIFLFVCGVKSCRFVAQVKRDSIQQRD